MLFQHNLRDDNDDKQLQLQWVYGWRVYPLYVGDTTIKNVFNHINKFIVIVFNSSFFYLKT